MVAEATIEVLVDTGRQLTSRAHCSIALWSLVPIPLFSSAFLTPNSWMMWPQGWPVVLPPPPPPLLRVRLLTSSGCTSPTGTIGHSPLSHFRHSFASSCSRSNHRFSPSSAHVHMHLCEERAKAQDLPGLEVRAGNATYRRRCGA